MSDTHATIDEMEKKKTLVVEVERIGAKLLVPTGMTYDEAIGVLQSRAAYERQEVAIIETFDGAFAFDAAHAFSLAMREMFGWFNGKTTHDMWEGKKVPQLRNIAIGVNETVQVPMGTFQLPNITGEVALGFHWTETALVFYAKATVLRVHENQIKQLFELTRSLLKTHSIYRGKAVRLRFRDSEGDRLEMPEPKFMDLKHIRDEELILPADVQAAVETNLWIPITRREDCRKLKIPLKRGVLLTGPFGVGKTLTANLTAKKAVDNGTSFVYCERAEDFSDVVKFALQYGPAVVFCEDIDRVLDEDRDSGMDDILNIVDGIEAKNTEMLFVLTTNEPDKIHQAMLRPGRLDAIINFTAPDAYAAIRLARMYGGSVIRKDEDLTSFGELAKGNIPAVIREIVERAKLSALRFVPPGSAEFFVPAEALLDSATTMKMQLDLLNREEIPQPSDLEKIGLIIGSSIERGVNTAAQRYDLSRLVPKGNGSHSTHAAIGHPVG